MFDNGAEASGEGYGGSESSGDGWGGNSGSDGWGGDSGSDGWGGDSGSDGWGGDSGSDGWGGDSGSDGWGGDSGSASRGGDSGSDGWGGDSGSASRGGDSSNDGWGGNSGGASQGGDSVSESYSGGDSNSEGQENDSADNFGEIDSNNQSNMNSEISQPEGPTVNIDSPNELTQNQQSDINVDQPSDYSESKTSDVDMDKPAEVDMGHQGSTTNGEKTSEVSQPEGPTVNADSPDESTQNQQSEINYDHPPDYSENDFSDVNVDQPAEFNDSSTENPNEKTTDNKTSSHLEGGILNAEGNNPEDAETENGTENGIENGSKENTEGNLEDTVIIIDPHEINGVDSSSENFWNHHGNTKEDYMDLASHLQEVQDQLNQGVKPEDIAQNPELKDTYNAYYNPDNMVKVELRDGKYEFQDDGRHRVEAAKEMGYDIPVCVVDIDGQKNQSENNEKSSEISQPKGSEVNTDVPNEIDNDNKTDELQGLKANSTYEFNNSVYETDDNGGIFKVDDNLLPDKEFTVNGITYTTNDRGLVSSFEGYLVYTPDNERDNGEQKKAGGVDREPNDDGTHLISRLTNGSPKIENMTSVRYTINRGDLKRSENEWVNALKEGDEVYISGKLYYPNNSSRPSSIEYEYSLKETSKELSLDNKEGSTELMNELKGSISEKDYNALQDSIRHQQEKGRVLSVTSVLKSYNNEGQLEKVRVGLRNETCGKKSYREFEVRR